MGSGASSNATNVEKEEFANMIVGEVRKQKERDPNGYDCDTLEKAQKEIKRIRHFCNFISEKDLEKFAMDQGSTLSKRVVWNEQEENRALGVLMAVKDKISSRFVSLREAFSKMDVDSSGFVDKHEFLNACKLWGLNLEEADLQLLLSYQTSDESSLKRGVNYASFLNMLTLEPLPDEIGGHMPSSATLEVIAQMRDSMLSEVETLERAFELVDTDNSGFIDAGEMASAFKMFNVECTRDMLSDLYEAYDTDDDNRFCYAEFEKVFEKIASRAESFTEDTEALDSEPNAEENNAVLEE